MGIDPSVLARLAIFPLPDAILFPGTVVPLHVFEPRYVEMTRDVVTGTRHMAIARLRPGFQTDYHGRPPVYPIAGAGEVIACQELPGDRFAIAVRGVERINIERELPAERAYREVVAASMPDRKVDEAGLALERGQLVAVCERIAAGLGNEGEALRALLREHGETGALTHALAAALVREADERQALLESRDPARRVMRLIEHASRLVATLGEAPGALN